MNLNPGTLAAHSRLASVVVGLQWRNVSKRYPAGQEGIT